MGNDGKVDDDSDEKKKIQMMILLATLSSSHHIPSAAPLALLRQAAWEGTLAQPRIRKPETFEESTYVETKAENPLGKPAF